MRSAIAIEVCDVFAWPDQVQRAVCSGKYHLL